MEKVIKDLQTNTGDLEKLKNITCVVQVKIFLGNLCYFDITDLNSFEVIPIILGLKAIRWRLTSPSKL